MIPIVIVFFIAGLSLNTKDMGKALRHWPGVVWGIVAILAVTPCLGFALRAVPLVPSEFAAGLAIFAAAPTTLGVGAALVRSAGGNDTLATMLMTGTSLLSVFTIPLWLKALLGSSSTASDGSTFSLAIDVGQMFWQLVVTVLVPALVGKAARELVGPARRFATKWKQALGMLSVLCLAFIVWQTLSGAQALLVAQQFVQILYVILAAIAQHLVYLAFNVAVLAAVFKMPVEEGVAVAIMGSQKSAPVAVTAITYVTKDAGIQGLLSVPCIVGQLAQIFLGAAYAPWVARRVKRVQAARKEAEAAGAAAAGGGGDGGAAAAAAAADGADGAEGKAVELANLDLEAPPIAAAAAVSTLQPQ